MRFFFLITLFSSSLVLADSWWSIEARTGTAVNFSTNLKLEQDGFPEIDFRADYETRPFEDSPYYGWRLSRRNQHGAWEIEFVHHKIYLTNPPPEVQHFEVTHGYNLLYFNRSWVWRDLDLRAGAGIVISHAESSVRGVFQNSGYELSGLTGQLAIEKRFYVSQKLFVGLEAKWAVASATVAIARGEAKAPNMAVHVLAGLGYDFK